MGRLTYPIIGAGGGKGGGGGSAPSESPNTLQSNSIARVIDLISEGEIVGLYTGEGADGKDFPLKAVYFDNIPVQSSDGGYIDAGLSEPELSHWSNLTELNFEGVEMWERVGLPDQDSIPEFSEVESEITINQEVTDPSPVLFVVTDNDVDAIRLKMRLPALYEQNSEGSLVPASINYRVEVKESGGSYFEIQDKTISGKNTSPYEYAKEFIFDEFPGAPLTFPLTFRVTRITPDSDKASKQQDLFVNSYTEIQKVRIKYNDSAIVAIKVDSELFSGRVPQRSFLVRGIKIQVPSNYFPETRLYNRNVTTGAEEVDGNGNPVTQAWDGLFYTEWSDNPAWVLYDLLTNARYGLGEFIDATTQVDIFSLYDIAVYCDEKVDNGLGNGLLEPRYTFNGVVATREDAFDVLNAITSTFRGMSYWSAGGVTAVADSPKDPKRLITRANVEKGHFVYSGTSLRSQHTAALITYNDPENNYKQTIEVVEDAARRERFGWREIEVAGFATTSRGQAFRLGKWILDSEKNESETLAFTSGVELSDLRPGDIVQVADPSRQKVRRGGRIISHTAGTPDVIVVDDAIQPEDGDTLLVTNVLGGIESLEVEASVSPSTTVTLKTGVTPTETLAPNAIYIHRGANLVPEEWRVLSMRETEDLKWEFSCLTYDSTKFARIEGVRATAIVDFVDSNPDTIVRVDGGSWISDGFLDGMTVTIADADEASNNGSFTVDGVTTDTLTLSADDSLTADTNDYINIASRTIVLDPSPTSFLPTGPLAPATNLTIFESIYKAGTAVQVLLDIGWTRSTDPRAQIYRVETRFRKTLSDPVDTWSLLTTTASIRAQIPNAEDGYWSFRVIAQINQAAATSSSSVLQVDDYQIIGKSAPPPNVTGLAAVRGFTEVLLDWHDVDDIDLSGYEVRRGSAWDAVDVEVLASPLYASTFTAQAKTTENQRYHVRAVDTLGNYSLGVASVSTSIQALPAVSNLYGYQTDDKIRLVWDSLSLIENIQYEVRAGSTWATANKIGSVANSEFQAPYPVSVSTSETFRVRPFLLLEGGGVSFGDESTITLTLLPIINGLRLHQRTEEPGWSGIPANLALSLLGGGAVPDESITEGSTINPTIGYVAGKTPPRVDIRRDASFHCNLHVASGSLPLGTIMETGAMNPAGCLVCFDGNGDLVVRAGSGYPELNTLADATNVTHRWILVEPDGQTQVDWIGSNDLTENGSAARNPLAATGIIGPSPAEFDGDSGGYLSASDVSINGKSWTLALWFATGDDFDGSGKLFQLGTGSTLLLDFQSGLLTATVNDGGSVSVQFASTTYTAGSAWTHVIVTFDETTKGLELFTSGISRDTATAAGSLVDSAGQLRIGESFAGRMQDVWWIERVVTADERTDLRSRLVLASGLARLVIPNASIPVDQDFDLAWDFRIGDGTVAAPGRVRAWINDTAYSATTYTGTYLGVFRWSGPANGKYNGVYGTHPEGEAGAFDAVLNGQVTLNSDLSYWHDQLADARLVVDTAMLTLTEGSTYGEYEFPFNLGKTATGRLSAEMSASAIAADPLEIAEALMLIDDTSETLISESLSEYEPQVELWIDIENTGTFIPLEAGTYRFENSTVRVILRRGPNELIRPAVDSLTVSFVENPSGGTLQASTTDATETTLTFDGGAVSATNIPIIPDDFAARIEGRLIGRNSANGDMLEIVFNAHLRRATGAASTTVTYSLTELERDDADWVLSIEADTTYGGLAVKVTGEAATSIEWLCDIDVREVG